MTKILDITNHVRQCSVYSMRRALEDLQKQDKTGFSFVARWLLSLNPDHANRKENNEYRNAKTRTGTPNEVRQAAREQGQG